MNKILIHKGDSTVFANINKFLTFNLETDLDLTGWQARFILGWVERTIYDISTKSFEIILSAQDTKQLRLGTQYGTIILTDSKGNIKTVVNTIPFEVTTAVVENKYQEIDLTIPESSGVDIKLKVGASVVTSVNGMTGDVILDIPSIEGLATEQQLEEGLDTKQDKGNYALKEEIPSLEEYVKNTDYAKSGSAGIINVAGSYGTAASVGGYLRAVPKNLAEYNESQDYLFIAKGTLENIKDDYVKRGVTENSIELTADEQASARTWLGAVGKEEYATRTTAGVVISNTGAGVGVNSSGQLYMVKAPDKDIQNKQGDYKSLVPSNIDLAVKTGVTTNTYTLSDDEKASAKQWLGYATPTDIMQAIASIPQFKLSIVEALPETGEKMTLYLVSKGTESPDVYDEYIWIEETSTFEFLGTTAVDLTDYVKNTDYATHDKGGVVKTASTNGVYVNTGQLVAYTATLDQYKTTRAGNSFISKGTLENIKNDYVKRGLTENTLEFTDEEKTSARTLIGAVGSTDYATSSTGGVIKISSTYATAKSSDGYLQSAVISDYSKLSQYGFISKGTLNNVLTQYSKTVSLTQADYEALVTAGTVDENTLYLIEE